MDSPISVLHGDAFSGENAERRIDCFPLDAVQRPRKVTERMSRINFGHVETGPVKFTHKIMLDEELVEFICGENEKDAPHLVAK